MKNLLCAAILASMIVLPAPAATVWIIGDNANTSTEMEHENDADDLFYQAPGNYTTTYGYDVNASTFTLAGANRTTAEPLIVSGNSAEGFERAIVAGGERAVNIFFQLQPSHLAPGSRLRLDVDWENANAPHNVSYYLNGRLLTQQTGVVAQSLIRDEVPVAGSGAVAGSNVLSIVRTGGTGTWATFDQLVLNSLPQNEIFSFGFNNNSNSEFEQEGSPRNDPKFYFDAGDYTGVVGLTGAGANRSAIEAIRNDANAEGMPRALVPGVPTVDIFFQMDEFEAAQRAFRFQADLFALGGGSSHDLAFYLNGQQFYSLANITGDRLVDVIFEPSLVNEGGNVLSIRRTGGGSTNPWIQFDHLGLEHVVPEPASLAMLALAAAGIGRYVRRRRR